MADFPTVTLESLALPVKGSFAMGPFGSDIKTDNFVEFGVPIIKGQNLGGSRLLEDSFDFLTEEKADELSNSIAKSGDIVFTHRGTLGQVVMIPRKSRYPRYIVSQSQMKVSLDEKLALPEYVTYYFQSSVGQHVLMSYASQTGVPAIGQPLTSLRKMLVILPSIEEQRAIASVLGALDDKIEANRRLVETAKDFIDALFWTAFSDGEMNLPVSSLAEVVDCLHTKKPEQALDGKQLLQLSNISDDGFLILGNHYPISLDDYVKWTANIEAREGDVVLTNVGRVGALARIPSGVRAALGRNMTAIRARKSSDALFIFAALNNPQVRRGLKSLIDVGTIMDALNVHAIRRILLPDSTALQRDNFALSIGDLVERSEVAVKESRDLDNLRDALLPELLSGRMRVKDAESMMENV